MENGTEVTDFILVGLTNAPELQIPLFIVFTLIYLISVSGNLGMITLILLDSYLHTPMYFFIINLSLVDFGYSSAVTLKAMAGFLEQTRSSHTMPVLLRYSFSQPLPVWKISS